MPCRIGSTSRTLSERHKELIDEKKVPKNSKIKEIAKGLTFEGAAKREKSEITKCKNSRKSCDGSPGGPKKSGNIYKVYRIDW